MSSVPTSLYALICNHNLTKVISVPPLHSSSSGHCHPSWTKVWAYHTPFTPAHSHVPFRRQPSFQVLQPIFPQEP